ncbi:MAG: hypothetical protein RBS05_21450 [Zoogloea oleivorans]|jgi:prophage tail gpP-like protein|uniref:phage baseplate assembly protein n=1 Tax=Zoogloea oleivorans TaxID=1552750 RepID=UPI002A35BE14|nr:hypothetical protein [Zoogloea oleivorans]MDY0038479.1 hypothetical protein [Zoogloea oleivorans]
MADAVLIVGAKRYSGWTALRVQRGIEQASGAFGIHLTERWPGQSTKWPIEPGAECQLLLDDTPVITGYIDGVDRELTADNHVITAQGRDKAADIVDCSALLPGDKTGDLVGQTLHQVASILCEPFGIKVVDRVGTKPIPKFSIQLGSVWEHIERGARDAAVMVMSDGLGSLVITRAGTERHPVALVEGENILEAKFVRSDARRYNRYIMSGQSASDDFVDAEIAAHASDETTDGVVIRNRPYVMDPDHLAPGVSMRDRVRWERNVRRGKSRRVEVEVQGWSAGGRLWRPNELVNVRLPMLGLPQAELLIVSVEHMLDDQGTLTKMTLSPAEAYDLLPEGQKAKGGIQLSPEQERLLG